MAQQAATRQALRTLASGLVWVQLFPVPGTSLTVRARSFWLRAVPNSTAMPVLRVWSAVSTVLAVCAAAGAFLDFAHAPLWLAASAGLGGTGFGASQAVRAIGEQEARKRKVRGLARLARRSLDEMLRASEGVLLRAWVERIGRKDSLEPLERTCRELMLLGAEAGEPEAALSEAAFGAFLRMSDHLNPMFERRAGMNDLKRQGVEDKATLFEGVLTAIGSLEPLAPREPHENIDAVRQKAIRFVATLKGP